MFSEYKLSQIYPDLQIRKVFDIQEYEPTSTNKQPIY